MSDPIVAGGHFAVAFHYDITAKATDEAGNEYLPDFVYPFDVTGEILKQHA